MKCEKCGKETGPGPCPDCGVQDSRASLEVTYHDFKRSEMLDIRAVPAQKAAEPAEAPAQRQEGKTVRRLDDRDKRTLALLLLLLLVLVSWCAYWLLRFLGS